MTTLFIYSIKAAFVLTLLFLPYSLMLRRESFFRMNRITLLTILMLSLVLPLCNFPSLAVSEQPAVYEFQQRVAMLSQTDEISAPASASSAAASSFSWMSAAMLAYILGLILSCCVRFWQLLRVEHIIRKGCLWEEKHDDATVYCHIGDVAPFSWMHSIVISENDYEPHGREILLHEKAHILHHHSFDILLLTFVESLQWWNPVAYLLGNSLRDIHEFEADNYVLHQGVSLGSYEKLLVKKALANTSHPFVNNFNCSLVRKRIQMMHHPKPNPWMRSKVLYLIPLTMVVLIAFATPRINKQIEHVVREAVPSSAIKPEAVIADAQMTHNEPTTDITKTAPEPTEKQPVVNAEPVTQEPIYKATNRIVIEGEVQEGLQDAAYQVYLSDDNEHFPDEPDALIPVNNHRFSYTFRLDKPHHMRLVTVFADGTVNNAYMHLYVRPGQKTLMRIMDGHFYDDSYPIFDKQPQTTDTLSL